MNLRKPSLSKSRPDLAKQFHPTKNQGISPNTISDSYTESIWWICEKDHEWKASPRSRAKNPDSNCKVCSSLAYTHPDLAKEWHPEKNRPLTPYDVTAGSHKIIWWKCPKESDHEWQSEIRIRAKGAGCQVCNKRTSAPSNCLATSHPEISSEWDYEANEKLGITPSTITEICRTKVSWKCLKNHKWKVAISTRTSDQTKCPYCTNRKVSIENSLAVTHPEIAAQWHPTKNGGLTPAHVTFGSQVKVWWKCLDGNDHEWESYVYSRTSGRGCPVCLNRKVTRSNCLATTHPFLASEWDYEKNAPLTPYDVTAGSTQKVYWKCPEGPDHEWKAQINWRASGSKNSNGKCTCCQGKKVVLSNCLATLRPDIAEEWDPKANKITPYEVTSGSSKQVSWLCKNNPEHKWQASVNDRVSGHGCPYCNLGWNIENIRIFIRSILPFIDSLPPCDLYVLFQQNGLLNLQRKGKTFIEALKTGKFPTVELSKFANNKPSLVESFFEDPTMNLEYSEENLQDPIHSLSETALCLDNEDLPVVETNKTLAILDSKHLSNFDKEAVEYFIKSAVARIWHHAFLNEAQALDQLKKYNCKDIYSQEVVRLFHHDYTESKNLKIPLGYSFPYPPNLMQRYTAYLVKSRKRLGNWSGTGAGKTLSAILASRVIDARLTIICCPNNVIDNWRRAISEIYPDSVIELRKTRIKKRRHAPTYLIFNYEFFQQPKAQLELKQFLDEHTVDFVIIDEIHHSKQRRTETLSKRKKVISSFLYEAAAGNQNLHVLGMSATPVINNLYEGKTLIELVTGIHHDDLNTQATISNCLSLFQKFVSHGIRWIPKYTYKMNLIHEYVDCKSFIPEIRDKSLFRSMADLEAVLTKAKIPSILKNLKPKTIIYTHYIKNILSVLQESIEQKGWKVSVFTGDSKEGLEDFIKGDCDILIASSCVGTGVDRLQHVCNRLIINSLPWTHAEFEQLKGRIYRQGQKSDSVDIIIPLTFAEVNGQRWSWCDSRWNRIQFKKSIADAAVDGVIPEGHLRSPAQAFQDAMLWLERLHRGELYEIERREIIIPLSTDVKPSARRQFGTLSQMNLRMNHATSMETHARFLQDPQEWEYYHAAYREDRKDWPIVPYQEAIKWLKARPHMVIGDFGCGEAFLAKELENRVISFDHIAIHQDVVACDMAHVPLDDGSLDAAVFSLSLMGSNFIDYLREAHRCLKLDGHLWIAEPTSRIQDIKVFRDLLFRLGFDVSRIDKKWKFTFVRALKTERDLNQVVFSDLQFKTLLN